MDITPIIECLDCGASAPFHPSQPTCASCGSDWREARYPLETLGPDWIRRLRERPMDLWRYQELLPAQPPPLSQRLGEGGTPLLLAHNLGVMLGLPRLYVKDERQGPTSSFKDRQAAVTVAALKQSGLKEIVVASTGNVAIAYSACCARAGIKLWAFLTSLVPGAKMHEVALYGTQVVKVTSTYDQAKRLAVEFAARRDLYIDRGTRSVLAVEAMKTIAFEIAEQLTGQLPPREGPPWRAPDWYFQAVSGGIGPLGVLKGFQELHAAGLIDRVPAIACIQAEGCAPMAQAWKSGASAATPVESPSTHISTLSTGDPGRAYTLLRERMLTAGGGIMESVSDEEAMRAMHTAAKVEGLSMEPAAAVAFAGLIKLTRAGLVRPEHIVVVNCSGHTMPIEKTLLGDGWAHELGQLPDQPEEGLLAALVRLDQRRVHRVLIVDDHADTRRLIRRILQAQGDFEVFEAESGAEALREAKRIPADLVILDLMMPEMDGFAVLERLRAQPETARIPIIVVTAKMLTPTEKARLEGQIAQLMLKGDFLDDDLLEEINRALR